MQSPYELVGYTFQALVEWSGMNSTELKSGHWKEVHSEKQILAEYKQRRISSVHDVVW
jgi:hypothetical protein